jgi:P4 family phage/plasmid primase-like protien
MMEYIPKSLEGFLAKNKSNGSNTITHTNIGSVEHGIYGGSYSITDADEDIFQSLYLKEVILGGKDSYLTEVQLTGDGQLLVDIDERYDSELKTRLHTDDHILDLIGLYIEKIKDMVVVVERKFEINVYVLEKDNINRTPKYVKDGIHLVFGISLSHPCQIILRNKVLEEINDIFEDLPLINSYNELVDGGIAGGKTNWQVFGSKKPAHEAYKLKKIFKITLSEENDIVFNDLPLPDEFTVEFIKQISARNTTAPSYELTEETKEAVQHLKSKRKGKGKVKIKVVGSTLTDMLSCMNSFPNIKTLAECEAVMSKIAELSEYTGDYNIIMADKLAQILNSDYYVPYENWMKVGWTMKIISPLLFPSWLLFSSKSPDFDWVSNDCFQQWQDLVPNGGLTMGSLKYWAKDCNYIDYTTIVQNSIDYYLFKTLDGETEYDVAKLVYAMYEGDFKCCSIRNKIWYEYKKGRWSEIESGTTLRHALSSHVSKRYHEKVKDTLESLDDSGPAADTDSDVVKNMRSLCCKLSKMALHLKKTAWKQNIMRECCEVFFDKYFMDLLDTNTELLCFNNGVLDIEARIFREGRPDDYLSLCTNTEYIQLDDSNPEHTRIKGEITLFMEQLFPIPAVKEYMWSHLASVLRGDNRNQTFNIYTGSGRNGKSKLVELMSLVLGDYKGSVPLALITQKRGSIGGVSPEIAQLKGLRYAVMQEPSKGAKLNEGIMKELTGGDPIQGRALFKDTVTFIPQFSLVVCTNHLFDITASDDGTWRRIRVIDLMSRFVDNPSEDPNDYEFQVDRDIDIKFKEWVPIFTSMLVNRLFETNGLVKDCPEVMAASQKYKAQQDYFTGFMKERIVKLEGGRIRKTDVLHEFQEWYSELYGGKVPSGKELYEFLEKSLGKPNPTGWKGWNLYHSYDLVDDNDIAPNNI